MPLFKGIASKAKPKKAIDYITNPKKAVIISSLSMDDNRSYTTQFMETCDICGKGKGHDERKYYHFKLSPDPSDYPSPQAVHELAEQMAQHLFSAHECVIATHLDTDATHTHIIINAVSFETGKKFHMNIGEYRDAKDLADIFGEEHGFTALDWRTKTAEKYARLDEGTALTSEAKFINGTEHSIVKRDKSKESGTSSWLVGAEIRPETGGFQNAPARHASWKEALRQAIDDAKLHCSDRTEFEHYLIENYDIIMPRNTAKTVSFVHPAVGEKYTVRGVKLGADYTVDSIDIALAENKERSVLNARLFTSPVAWASSSRRERPAQEEYTNASTDTRANNAIISSKPTTKTGNGERITPRSISDISAELRSLDNAVHRITNPVQQEFRGTDSMATKPIGTSETHDIHRHGDNQENVATGREKPSSAVNQVAEHERSVQQKPKRHSNSYER